MIDFEAVKRRAPLAEYCRDHGIELLRYGLNLAGLCPLHDESGPSFTVYPDNHFHCFGCGAHGDVVDLDQAIHGGTRREAAERLAGQGAIASIRPLARIKEVARAPVYLLTEKDRAFMNGACERLARAPHLASRVREGLPLAAVRLAAEQGHLGFCHDLAFGGDIRGPALLFAYSRGIKARWPGKVIRWFRGGPHGVCWRQSLLGPSHRRIFLTEGETDCLSLLSIRGLEEPGSESLILALPGATILPDPKPFQTREIVMVPDNDEAGRKCAADLARRLKPYTTSIKVLKYWG